MLALQDKTHLEDKASEMWIDTMRTRCACTSEPTNERMNQRTQLQTQCFRLLLLAVSLRASFPLALSHLSGRSARAFHSIPIHFVDMWLAVIRL